MFESCVASEPSLFKDKRLSICSQGKEVNLSCGNGSSARPGACLTGGCEVRSESGVETVFPILGLLQDVLLSPPDLPSGALRGRIATPDSGSFQLFFQKPFQVKLQVNVRFF